MKHAVEEEECQQKRGRGKEEVEEREGLDRTYGSPCKRRATTEATSAGEGIPEIPVPVREWGAGGGHRERRVEKVDEE